jgi:hypothetical protein
VIGQRFTIAKRHVALFCVGLCVALSVQMTVVVLDQLKHVLQIDHAPNALAGAVFDHAHHLKVEAQYIPAHSHGADDTLVHEIAFSPDAAPVHDHDAVPSHPHDHDALPHTHGAPDLAHEHDDDAVPHGFHTHDGLPQGHDHGSTTHHHHGTGMLAPWLVSVPLEIVGDPIRIPVLDYGITGHPDAPAWRRDRPPKLNLERIA